MLNKLQNFFLTQLAAWVGFTQNHKLATVFTTMLIAAASTYYAINNLDINTDTTDMLSPDLAWRQLDQEYEKQFPHSKNNILLVIEADTPDQAMDNANLLYQRLSAEKTLFKSVFSFRSLDFFQRSSLLFLDLNKLQDLSDRLAEIQPFLTRLTGDQNLRGLFSMLEKAIVAKLAGENINLEPLIERINKTMAASINGQQQQLSWHELMVGEGNNAKKNREFIILQPRLDFGELFPAENAFIKIRQIAQALNIENSSRLRITGDVALSQEELQSVMTGTEISIIVALCLVTVIMIIGLGSIWLVLATIITLLTGLLLTTAWATLTVGTFNLISIAFAVLYIGLGVDFSIHYCLRYREHFLQFNDAAIALKKTSLSCGGSLFLCSVTTAIGFYAFIPTDYDGIAELGWIAGSGMFISFIITVTLLPALLGLLPYQPTMQKSSHLNKYHKILNLPKQYAVAIKILTIISIPILIMMIQKIQFDQNILNLQNPENESVSTYFDLLADNESSPLFSVILAENKQQARQWSEQISRLPLVEKVIWLEKFIPKKQSEKLEIIDNISLLLGEISVQEKPGELSDVERLAALNSLHKILQNTESPLFPATSLLRENLQNFLSDIQQQSPAIRSERLQKLEQDLIGGLAGRLHSLNTALSATEITELPTALSDRWFSKQQQYLLEIYPRENLQNNLALKRFTEQLQAKFPTATGGPIISIEAGNAVVSAFRQAFLFALLAISALLLLLLKPRKDAVLIIIPLLIAASLTVTATVLLRLPLNFANIIALPLLLGIGVDSGIHILHRHRNAPPTSGNILETSSARAVFVSGLTTIFGVGNLALSPHLGTASMGKLLTIGISMTLICTLILLPSLLTQNKD